MNSVTNGSVSQHLITYKPLTDSSVYTIVTGAAFPQQNYQGPMYVVSQYTASDGVGGNYPVTYSYKVHELICMVAGSQDSAQIEATDTRTNIVTQTNYYDTTHSIDPSTGFALWPMFGMVSSQYTMYGGNIISSTINTFPYAPL